MSWIFEEPLYIAILGLTTLAFVGFAWMQTGSRTLLHAAIGTVALTLGLLLMEHLVQTDAEQIEATIRHIARDVQQNDHEAVCAHIDPAAQETLALAKRELPRYQFSRATVKRNMEIVLDQRANPPTAHASFNARVDVREADSGHLWREAGFVEVVMRKVNGQWMVAGCRYQEPTAPLRRR